MKNLLIAFSLAIFSSGALTETTVLVLNGARARTIYRKFKTEVTQQEDGNRVKIDAGLLKCVEIINAENKSYQCLLERQRQRILELDGADAREIYGLLNIGIVKKIGANWKASIGTLSCLVDDSATYQCHFEATF